MLQFGFSYIVKRIYLADRMLNPLVNFRAMQLIVIDIFKFF